MIIAWRKDLETGIEKIDDQHKELINKVNDLLNACNEMRGKEEISNTIKFLGDYVVTHFNDEEEIQKSSGYPGYERHKLLHEKFKSDFVDFKKDFDENGANVSLVIDINNILIDWLIKHISHEDKAIADYINNK